MSTAPTRSTPVAPWVLAGLALFLLYLLSAPVFQYGFYSPLTHLSPPTFDPRKAEGRERLALAYAAPYHWLSKHTLLHPILDPYSTYWYMRLFGGW